MTQDEAELFDERVAIAQESNVDWREAIRLGYEQVEQFRHECEVREIVSMALKKGGGYVDTYLTLIARHRGSKAATRLRLDARKAYLEARNEKSR